MIQKIIRKSAYVPMKVKQFASLLDIAGYIYQLYKVDIEFRHVYWIFVTDKVLPQMYIDMSSVLQVPFVPAEHLHESLDLYVLRLPASLYQ